MDLSVVIVSYKGWERLIKCLESLESFEGSRFSMEVIVVDNNSNDDLLDKLEKQFSHFRFIRNIINGGFAYGCNIGASSSKGEFLLFLNPDTEADEAETEKLLNAAKSNPSYFIISCRQISENGKETKATGSFPGLVSEKNLNKRSSSFGKKNGINKCSVSFPDWVSGSVMLFRREVFDRLKGFDEDFWMYSEDVDICLRARNKGGEIAYYPDINIMHNHGGSSRIDLKTTSVTKCEVQISKHVYIHKHKSGAERFIMHALLISDNLIAGFLSGLIGMLLFFIPKLFVRTLIFIRMVRYYFGSELRKSWMSPRSVNFRS